MSTESISFVFLTLMAVALCLLGILACMVFKDYKRKKL